MGKCIDLHTHSTASDGSMSPGELVKHAKECGLSAISITDHDTIDGVAEALEYGETLGIEVIPGLEISAEFELEMHILGYFPKSKYKNIQPTLLSLRESREKRNPKIVNKLREMGFDISMEEVKREAFGEIIGRPHIAKVMLRKGFVSSIKEAFDKYLSIGRPAYFKKNKLTPKECIEEILKAGGVPVLAHPSMLDMSYHELDETLASLKKDGLIGIEAYYVENSPEDTEYLVRLADKYSFIKTGGSDYHGSYKPDIEIGKGYGNLYVPYELLEELKSLL
ncbi:MAG TPA: PHP domain-containing protein [Clostridiaceae bacterium]|nr:PHP domain-containing protein [Clostridiaceae bacterium]